MSENFNLDNAIRKIKDFPIPGVLFYDITSIMMNPVAFKWVIDQMVSIYKDKDIGAIAAVESRGFIFGAPMAERLGIPMILVRKSGKLPGDTIKTSYKLEYGEAEIEIHTADITKGHNVLIVDDLLATGGTLKATAELLVEGGAIVTDVFSVIGLPFLNYSKMLDGLNITTLINYDSE
ncbi:MAG: adenine phosphoribosyltransferase [Spirochaetaceae bacterium]|jgi:adenine phosphoribosyltransferase|nr:adenine phosphoribosyltransferase [Spirochaetaceae bacterium]